MASVPVYRADLQRIQVVGGNLFQLAAQYLGDARQWERIAKLNGLWDPQISGIVTLTLPRRVDPGSYANGGILGN